MMNFGNFIRQLRQERSIDIKTLSLETGVEISTISRVENERTQVTLSVALRLCDGLEVTVTDLFEALRERHVSVSTKEWIHEDERTSIPTVSDIETFLLYYHTNKQKGRGWLSDLLNSVALLRRTESTSEENFSPLFVPEDIQKLLFDSPMYRFEIQYPSRITAENILEMYQDGGVLTLFDLGEYIKRVRREKHITLAHLENSASVSASVLSRLESGSIEQLKLIDVLALDEQLEQEGKLLAMYWSVYRFNENVTRKYTESDLKLAYIFILTCRWFQAMSPNDSAWISAIRVH